MKHSACILLLIGLLTGCATEPIRGSAAFYGPDPSTRIGAALHAVDNPTIENKRGLVSLLEDEDAGVRSMAIASLRKLTGHDLGYDATAAESGRREALKRWKAWLSELNPR